MRDIELTISSLIENQFPQFYKEEGPNFIAFVKAYYEWLEESTQYLTLYDATGFDVGDTMYQTLSDNVPVEGTIISKEGNVVGVAHKGLEQFRCINQCGVIREVTSSSGAKTYISISSPGGLLYQARNLYNYRDIDHTVDRFIIQFKEKYLKNIQFDTATNKKLLVKNAMDLYRSKGTERSIDLFFKLVYGVNSEVYYPGDDLLRPSDGEWVRPRYLEVTTTDRTVDYVGRQIVGVNSGATAFVERYIRRRIQGGTVSIVYISNIRGEFVNGEPLKVDFLYKDAPRVVGSLDEVEVITGSRLFNVGDVVSFDSTRGDGGLARVTSVANKTGVVDFLFHEGGFGYTLNAESIVSEKVLNLTNVVTANTIDVVRVVAGGTGYANSDKIIVVSPTTNATGYILTNDAGTILEVDVVNPGSGFVNNTPQVLITNSSGGSTTGVNANLVANTTYQGYYYKYLEQFVQRQANATFYDANNTFVPGEKFFTYHVNNMVASDGVVISVSQLAGANDGELYLSINAGSLANGTVLYTTGNTKTATINVYTDKTATATIMGIPSNAQLIVTSASIIAPRQEIYQTYNNIELANAYIVVADPAGVGRTSLEVTNLRGAFDPDLPIRIRNSTTTATLINTNLNIGVYNIVGTFATNAISRSTNTSTTANTVSVSFGYGAGFNVSSIGEVETIFLGTDLLGSNNVSWIAANLVSMANQQYMTLPISNYAYGFPKNPQGNSADIIYACLDFQKFDIGVVGGLTNIDPGAEYNVDPYVLIYEPLIAAFGRNDYIFEIENASGLFTQGERILQTSGTLQFYNLQVDSVVGFQIGEKVFQGTIGSETATAVVQDIYVGNNTFYVNQVTGSFATGQLVKSYITANTATLANVDQVSVIASAKGIVKSGNTSVITIKRISFNNTFDETDTIVGQSSGVSATIKKITEDERVRQIGLNANVEANVVTANGSVTALEIIDSGFGYSNGEIVNYVSEDGSRTGEAKIIVNGSGTGSGYYRSSKGFLSADKYIHDSDYYQEYSYEVLSKLPFDRYSDMFKKVMHTAGTRVFGSVVITEESNTSVESVDSLISTSLYERIQFNANSAVSNMAIVFDNDYANTQLVFSNGEEIVYEALEGNTAIRPLSNGAHYFVSEANATSIKLVTNPRTISQSFNSNSDIDVPGYITLPQHNFVTGDYVKYSTNNSANSVYGLIANNNYFVHVANATHIQLSHSANTRFTDISNNNVLANGSVTISAQEATPTGLFFKPDGTKMYVIGTSLDRVIEYDLTTPWQVNTAVNTAIFSVQNRSGNPFDLTFKSDGTKMYILDVYAPFVHEYNLSTPWQVNTASHAGQYKHYTSANSITFANTAVDPATDFITYAGANTIFANGTSIVFYTSNTSTAPGGISNAVPYVVRYANSSGFALSANTTAPNVDITSAGIGNEFYIESFTVSSDLQFSADGKKLFVSNYTTDQLVTHTLANGWQVNTASVAGSNLAISTADGSVQGFTFNTEGTKLFLVGSGNDRISSVTLTKAWDLSTATFDNRHVVLNANTNDPYSIYLKPDNSRFFILAFGNDTVREYDWYNVYPNQNETHSVAITTINIIANSTSSGASTNGHFITLASEY